MAGNKKNEELYDKIKNFWKRHKIIIIVIAVAVITMLVLDSINFISNSPFKQINVSNWVIFTASIIAVLGTYIYTRMENKKALDEQQKQFYEGKEIQKENSDKEVIMSLFGSGIIREETLWIFNRKQYKARINYMKNKSISKPVNETEVRNFGLKDIREFYDLYADIEIINEYVESEKYKKIFNKMIERREGKNTSVKIVLDPEEVIKAVTLTNYKNDIVKIRKEYIEKLLKIIK